MASASRVALLIAVLLLAPLAVSAQTDTIRCSIKAEPATTSAGEQVHITWSSFGATSATLDGASVPISGVKSFPVASSRTFKLTVKGSGGKQFSCETNVNVVMAKPSCFISAWPQTITQGQNATVSWGSSYATSLFIFGLGQVAPSGTRTVHPTMTTTYTLSAQGAGGRCTESARVTVQPQQSPYGYSHK